jgi:hypothetical protein
MNSAIKPLMPGNAREAIDKIVNIVNIFGMEIAIPPISSRTKCIIIFNFFFEIQ